MQMKRQIPDYILIDYPNNCASFTVKEKIEAKLKSNPNLVLDALYRCAETNNYGLLSVVASNPTTPVSLLRKINNLDCDIYDRVKQCLIDNCNFPDDLRWEYIKNGSDRVLESLSESNLSTSEMLSEIYHREYAKHLKFLENKEENKYKIFFSSQIRHRVAKNPNISEQLALEISKDSESTVRLNLASNENIPSTVALLLLNDKDDSVRATAIANKNISLEEVEKLAGDGGFIESRAIKRRLDPPIFAYSSILGYGVELNRRGGLY